MRLIPEDEFMEDWGAHGSKDNGLFEYEEIKNKPLRTIWTVVEAENGDWIAQPGFHVVNKLGYVLTTRHWDPRDNYLGLEAMWFENDFEEEDEAEEG